MLALVVDDDLRIRTYVRTILKWENFETLEAEGGKQAIEIVQQLDGGLDLIATDIQMPGGDGLTLARAVRENYPAVPVLLISGRGCPDPAFDYIEKPFDWMSLVNAVRRVVASSPISQRPRLKRAG
jgi:DNA-binding response OmpR family regulator